MKAEAHSSYVTAVEQKGETYTFTMFEKAKVHPEKIPELIKRHKGELVLKTDTQAPCFVYRKLNKNKKEIQQSSLEVVKNMLNEIKGLIEC